MEVNKVPKRYKIIETGVLFKVIITGRGQCWIGQLIFKYEKESYEANKKEKL